MGQSNDLKYKENEIFDFYTGIVINKYRQLKKYKLADAAKIVSLADRTIGRIERGENTCNLYNFYLLIHTLKIPKEEVIQLLYNEEYYPLECVDEQKRINNDKILKKIR